MRLSQQLEPNYFYNERETVDKWVFISLISHEFVGHMLVGM